MFFCQPTPPWTSRRGDLSVPSRPVERSGEGIGQGGGANRRGEGGSEEGGGRWRTDHG